MKGPKGISDRLKDIHLKESLGKNVLICPPIGLPKESLLPCAQPLVRLRLIDDLVGEIEKCAGGDSNLTDHFSLFRVKYLEF